MKQKYGANTKALRDGRYNDTSSIFFTLLDTIIDTEDEDTVTYRGERTSAIPGRYTNIRQQAYDKRRYGTWYNRLQEEQSR